MRRAPSPDGGRSGAWPRRWLAVALLCSGGACASTASVVDARELPVGLSSIGSLLGGCAPEGEDEVVRARCDGEVVLSLKTRLAGTAEPSFREEAFSLASVSGARLAWDRLVVPTEGPSGVVDRARALKPVAAVPDATLIGAVRSLGDARVQEVWCTSKDEAGDARCRQLVGAVLGSKLDNAATAGEASRAQERSPPPPGSSGAPAQLFGRALSLPTTCHVALQADGGDVSCADGASLSWRRLDSMEEASAQLTATLAAFELVDGQAFSCTLMGEAAQCEDHGRALAGLSYLDGAPVAVACFGPAAKDHALCRAVLRAR